MSAAPALALVPKRMSLFELVRDVEGIADLLDALDDAGELTPEVEEQLQAELIKAVAGTKDKVDRTCSVLASFDAAEAAAKAEAERLTNRARRIARQRDYLEHTVTAVLTASNLKQIDGYTSTLAIRVNPPAVQIDTAAEIPAQYLRTPKVPDPAPDKTAIKAALVAGACIPGCRIVQSLRVVRS